MRISVTCVSVSLKFISNQIAINWVIAAKFIGNLDDAIFCELNVKTPISVTLRNIIVSSYIRAHPGPFRPGDIYYPWWSHQMQTFFALLSLCAGNSPVAGELPLQMPVTRGFDVFFDLRLNTRLSKRSWGWWFEKPSRSLWRYCNDYPFCWKYIGHFGLYCVHKYHRYVGSDYKIFFQS